MLFGKGAGPVAGCLGDVGANSKRRIHSRKPTQKLPAAVGCRGCNPWPCLLLPVQALLLHAQLAGEQSGFASMKVNSFI